MRVFAALLFSEYDEFTFSYAPPDVIKFARQLGMAMEVALGSRAKVQKLLELLDVIESTELSSQPDTWPERTYRAIDYHPRLCVLRCRFCLLRSVGTYEDLSKYQY